MNSQDYINGYLGDMKEIAGALSSDDIAAAVLVIYNVCNRGS